MRRFRIGWRCAALVILVLAGAATQFSLFPFVGRRGRDTLTRVWSRACLAACGVGLHTRGVGGGRFDPHVLNGALILANHVSWLDILVINALRPAHFVAKSEVRRWPLVGLLARRNGTIFIERGRRHAVHDVIRRMVDKLRAGEVCAVFPEGTTSDGSALLPFHANLIEAALEAPAAVVPLAVRYLDHGRPSVRAAYVGETSLVESVLAVLGAPGLHARLDVAAAMSPPHAGTRHDLAARARQRMSALLEQAP